MKFSRSFRRAAVLALSGAGALVVAGCQEDKPAEPPKIEAPAAAATGKPAKPTPAPKNTGPGSSAATDSTLPH